MAAWTGNKPKELAAYYSEDVFYADPGIPNGVKGKAALLEYFQKLQAQNPDWVWTQIEAIPMEEGFLNKWHAKIPVGPKSVNWRGSSGCWTGNNETGRLLFLV